MFSFIQPPASTCLVIQDNIIQMICHTYLLLLYSSTQYTFLLDLLYLHVGKYTEIYIPRIKTGYTFGTEVMYEVMYEKEFQCIKECFMYFQRQSCGVHYFM